MTEIEPASTGPIFLFPHVPGALFFGWFGFLGLFPRAAWEPEKDKQAGMLL